MAILLCWAIAMLCYLLWLFCYAVLFVCGANAVLFAMLGCLLRCAGLFAMLFAMFFVPLFAMLLLLSPAFHAMYENMYSPWSPNCYRIEPPSDSYDHATLSLMMVESIWVMINRSNPDMPRITPKYP